MKLGNDNHKAQPREPHTKKKLKRILIVPPYAEVFYIVVWKCKRETERWERKIIVSSYFGL